MSSSATLQQKQIAQITRMLHLNQPNPNLSDTYKVLIFDSLTRDIISPLIHVKDLRNHGITLYFHLDNPNRQQIPDVPAVYFVSPSSHNIARIASDVSNHLYESFHLNFTSSLPRNLLEKLAEELVRSDSVSRVAKIYDQYTEFVTLEDDLFSLRQKDVYVEMNDPKAEENEINSIIDKIVNGLFCVMATLGMVPVIRCQSGGPAAMVAEALDSKLRDHLITKNNLFMENAGSVLARPVLCLFDRNFELAVGVQHDWNYRPLVHDMLGLKLNKLDLEKKVYELDKKDGFWVANSWSPFPKVAEEIEVQLSKYKQDVDEVNRKTGANAGDTEFDGTNLVGNTKHLVDTVNSLPELTERKKVIDRHTNIATVLLGKIKERSIDSYCTLENDMLTKASVDRNALIGLLKGKGSKTDKIRLAITYLLSVETTPQSELEAIELALKESEVDTCAFQYVKKIKSLNSSLASNMSSASKSNIVDWAEKLYGQSISAVTAGMKNLLSGGRQLALTRIVDALMDGRQNPEIESYLSFDPRAVRSGAQFPGPFKEAIVFMIGGGNYIEYRSLMELGIQSQPAKHVIYGTTELLNGEEFVQQLTLLGQKMGLGSTGVTPSQ